MSKYEFMPFEKLPEWSEQEMLERARSFYQHMKQRRTIRDYSEEEIPIEVINQCLLAAGTAPNGANHQPWHFAVVRDPEVKRQIREGAEQEEREFYQNRAPQEWLDALEPLGTDANKPFLEVAPYLIVIFAQKKMELSSEEEQEKKFKKNYYVPESVGIATGLLITALHHVGLSTLTHTPSPMNFLNKILQRPDHEKAMILLVVGKPTADAQVPKITKKKLEEIASYF